LLAKELIGNPKLLLDRQNKGSNLLKLQDTPHPDTDTDNNFFSRRPPLSVRSAMSRQKDFELQHEWSKPMPMEPTMTDVPNFPIIKENSFSEKSEYSVKDDVLTP
jgi:hypothetical protein